MAVTQNYVPGNVPIEASTEMRNFLTNELNRIAELFRSPFLFLEPSFEPPKKPVSGMIAYADGTQWNPGAGEGAYIYQYDSWQLIDSAKGFAGFDINQLPQPFNATTDWQIINVFQQVLPVGRPGYLATASLATSEITIHQSGLWSAHVGFFIEVVAAEILVFGLFINGVLAGQTALENTNQMDFESGTLIGSAELPAGAVVDLRIRTLSGPASIIFDRLILDMTQMRTPL